MGSTEATTATALATTATPATPTPPTLTPATASATATDTASATAAPTPPTAATPTPTAPVCGRGRPRLSPRPIPPSCTEAPTATAWATTATPATPTPPTPPTPATTGNQPHLALALDRVGGRRVWQRCAGHWGGESAGDSAVGNNFTKNSNSNSKILNRRL